MFLLSDLVSIHTLLYLPSVPFPLASAVKIATTSLSPSMAVDYLVPPSVHFRPFPLCCCCLRCPVALLVALAGSPLLVWIVKRTSVVLKRVPALHVHPHRNALCEYRGVRVSMHQAICGIFTWSFALLWPSILTEASNKISQPGFPAYHGSPKWDCGAHHWSSKGNRTSTTGVGSRCATQYGKLVGGEKKKRKMLHLIPPYWQLC